MFHFDLTKWSTIFPKKQVASRDNFWLTSIFWDVFWFHSGLWLVLLIIVLSPKFFSEIFYATGVFIFWISHRFSSLYLAWGTKSFRPLCKKQPIRFVVIPFLIGIGVFGFIFLVPEYFLPFSVLDRIVALFMIDFFWGAHHFAAQHYGVLRLYENVAKKNGFSNMLKNEDRIYCWFVGGLLVIFAEILHGSSYLQEKNILPFPTSIGFFEEIIFLKILGIIIVFGSTIYMIIKSLVNNSGYPKILYFLGIGGMVVGAFQLDPFQFLMIWTLQHWMVSLGLTAYMGANDLKKNNRKFLVTNGDSLFTKFTKKFGILLPMFFFSIVMTPFFEIEAVSINKSYTEKLLPWLMESLRESDWILFFVTIGIGTGFLHYWMDRAVYRFSDNEISKVTKKLLFSK